MSMARLLAAAVLVLNAVTATAQPTTKQNAITAYSAYRDGGGFVDAASDNTLRLEGSAAWAISYDRDLDASRQLQFYVSYQGTHLKLDSSAALSPRSGAAAGPLPIKVIYFHVGGINFFEGAIGQGPYVVGGLGATLFEPGLPGYSDEIRPSLNLGLGYQAALGETVAVRIEARGYATLFNSSGGVFCSGGCLFKIRANAVAQGEVQLGLSYRF